MAKADTLMCALDQTRNIGKYTGFGLGKMQDPQLRFKGGKGIVGDLGSTIIECVRYGYDRDKSREFLIHPSRMSAAGREGRSQWQK